MSDPLHIRVYEDRQLVYAEEFSEAVEIGRQREGEEVASPKKLESGVWRVVIAKLHEVSVGRQHALIESLPTGNARIKNLSTKQPILLPELQGGTEVKPGAACEVPLPIVLTLGTKTIRVERPETHEPELHSLTHSTIPPGRSTGPRSLPTAALSADAGVDANSLARWMQTTMDVLDSAANSSDFFAKAAQAVVDLVGLETGGALVLDEGWWKAASLKSTRAGAEVDWRASRHVLDRVRQNKATFWQLPDPSSLTAESLRGVQAVVAAPILNRDGEVIGALYGDRRQGCQSDNVPCISELEAMLVELLACSVAAGLARVEQEQAAVRARVQFEQFFTRELAEQLASQPDLLKGRDSDVTVLFCDIRGFSRITEQIGPGSTVDWISDVMGVLSDCVMAHRGVLVDYIGDELMAMWGAPVRQADHAKLACRAGIEMLEKLPGLIDKWLPTLQEPMELGIGINSGTAHVGNTGSYRKFKYGPLGNTVNLASRVQGATKYLKTKVLITGTTQARLDPSFLTRRLCQVRVVNIAEPVDLYELLPEGHPGLPRVKEDYEQALAEFERKNFLIAARALGNLRGEYPDDGPALVLLSRAVNCMVDEPDPFDPVWELPGK